MEESSRKPTKTYKEIWNGDTKADKLDKSFNTIRHAVGGSINSVADSNISAGVTKKINGAGAKQETINQRKDYVDLLKDIFDYEQCKNNKN